MDEKEKKAEQSILEGARAGRDIIIKDVKQEIHNYPQPQPLPVANLRKLPWTGAKVFVGRDEVIEELHKQLQRTQGMKIISVTGMGGIGKTELVLQYAYRYLKEGAYPGGVYWLNGRGEDLVQWESKEEGKQDSKVLVVFDDVQEYETIKKVLPPPVEEPFNVLITTQRRFGSPIVPFDLDLLKPRAAIQLLESFIGHERLQREPQIAQNLCCWLGYLPLGLELVGRYLEVEEDLSLSQMLEQLTEASLEDESLAEVEAVMTAERGVKAAFEISWKQLSEHAQALACLLGLFALSPIPWSLVEGAAQERRKKELKKDRRELLTLSLLKREYEETYGVHTLSRDFFQLKLVELRDTELPESITHEFAKIVEHNPFCASQILHQKMLDWDFGIQNPELSALRVGKLFRVAMQSWSRGIGSLSQLVISFTKDGNVPRIGTAIIDAKWTDDITLTSMIIAYYFGDQMGDKVVVLPPEASQYFATRDSRYSSEISTLLDQGWNIFHCMPYEAKPSWVWKRSFKTITEKLSQVIKHRSIPVLGSYLSFEAAWHRALYVTGRHYPNFEPIRIDDLESSLDKLEISKASPMIKFCISQLEDKLNKSRSQDENHLNLPSTFRSFFEADIVSPDILLEYVRDVYRQAIDSYQQLLDTWFSYLAPELQLASILPAQIVGVVIPSKHKRGSVSISWSWVSLPKGSKNSVDFELGDQELSRKDYRLPYLSGKEVKNSLHLRDCSEPIYPYIWVMKKEKFTKSWLGWYPVTGMVYRWLWHDLERIGWVTGDFKDDFSWK
ncbi:hypothetical protein PN466_01975 [Roseofilum reptotaenium CS-1145]|uniref:Novel STAND NTPase 5 domain-containing protein n=1 Tax=Roseofilum reptotaenium AO1-A TaxID=1925591 RepID=A0A1L9QN48_9CYAN|nr:hypothetical protein [Roseofilum reptotaenium]MDB9515727.1 hypothetical protein [Roseofilum reptotaenium CS-1145]OJJ24072.1 hypothetical protein BI308_18515 [Roseofilum reptotaenium AO1-A]